MLQTDNDYCLRSPTAFHLQFLEGVQEVEAHRFEDVGHFRHEEFYAPIYFVKFNVYLSRKSLLFIFICFVEFPLAVNKSKKRVRVAE